MPSRPDLVERHRKQREASHRRLLEVARELVEGLPWSEVSVGLIAERAGLTRTAFYKHFDDRRTLLLALFEEVGTELAGTPDRWQGGDDDEPEVLLRAAVANLVETFRRHGRLLSAIADEAVQDPAVADAWAQFASQVSAAAAARMERDIAAGRSTVHDPAEVATALVWMNERYLRARFGAHPLGDPERATAALSEIWCRTIYDTR